MESIQGRCMKCRQQVEITQPFGKTTRTGLFYVVGVCASCGTKVSRIIGKKTEEMKEGAINIAS